MKRQTDTDDFSTAVGIHATQSYVMLKKNLKSNISIALISSTTIFRGVSHDDYVDIRLAWFVLAFVFALLIVVELTFSWPENYDDGVTDDIFS